MTQEHGIIMSGNHPRLILDGTKTMTRRTYGLKEINEHPNLAQFKGITVLGEYAFEIDLQDGTTTMKYIKCPYGQVGDRLYCKETWAVDKLWDNEKPSEVNHLASVWYATDYMGDWVGKTRPSIFMPRWASRITLEITEVRVERLQEISIDDAFSEGTPMPYERGDGAWNDPYVLPRFQELWDSLYAKRGYSWGTNLFCWVISFKVVKGD